MKDRIKGFFNRIKGFIKRNVSKNSITAWVSMFILFMPGYAHAQGSYTSQLTNLKTILLTIGAAIGAVMLVWGGIQFAISFKKVNQQGEHDAILTVAAGAILVGISAVVTALG